VVPVAKRRTFSKSEKLRILAAADACVAPGEIGALLRQEGIYWSHLATWRKQRQASGETNALARKRGPKSDSAAARERFILELENQVERHPLASHRGGSPVWQPSDEVNVELRMKEMCDFS
jgi:transposase